MKICLFSLSFAIIFAAACSSLKKSAVNFYLMRFQDKKAENVKYLPPPRPYEKQSHPVLDALWWNPQSKSFISYFSSCSKVPGTLKDFQMSSFPEKGEYKLLESVSTQKGLYSVLEMLGVKNKKTYTGIYTLKQGKCYFNINLVTSSQTAFKAEEMTFKAFVKGFRPK